MKQGSMVRMVRFFYALQRRLPTIGAACLMFAVACLFPHFKYDGTRFPIALVFVFEAGVAFGFFAYRRRQMRR